MSGTPSISEAYSVLGGRQTGGSGRFLLPVSLVVLSRGPWIFRPQILQEAHGLGFFEVICVETGPLRYDTESLLRTIPELRFLVFTQSTSPGARINDAAREVRGDRFLVIWDDQAVPESGLHTRVQKLWQEFNGLALVPELRDREGRDLPSVQVPGLEEDRLKILALGADQENVDTLFAADYTALYDRQRFLSTGGYDVRLPSPFWQKVDWGLRSRLWGETLQLARAFKIDYRSTPPIENQTPDRSYSRFFLRTLAVRHVGDHGELPWSRFWAHARRSGLSLTAAAFSFWQERRWVRTHRYRFQSDARLLAELWGTR